MISTNEAQSLLSNGGNVVDDNGDKIGKVTQTVPVSHEEVRIEREPVTDANRGDAVSGGDITEEVHEVELKGERVAVSKETVPVERVRIDSDTVTEDQEVSEQLRKEQIKPDNDGINGSEDRDR